PAVGVGGQGDVGTDPTGQLACHVVAQVPGRCHGERLVVGQAAVGLRQAVGGHADTAVHDPDHVARCVDVTAHLDVRTGRRERQAVLDQFGEEVDHVGGGAARDQGAVD